MNCEWIREQLVETARGRELPSDLRAVVFDHAATCADCARLLENESQLTVALAELALYTDGAPARLEQMIRRQLPVSIRKPKAVKWVWAGLATAASLALAVLLIVRSGGVPVKQAVPDVMVAAAADPDSDADDFVPLPYAAEVSPDEHTDIVRVALPRESLLAMGLPVRADRFGEEVEADVMIGMDGTAKAIRLAN
jgi:hypothetical protein